MSYKNKRIISAVVASLIATTPSLYAGEKIKRSKSCDFGKYVIRGAFGLAALVGVKKVYDHYSRDDTDLFSNYNKSLLDDNQDDNNDEKPTTFVSAFYKNTEQVPSQYLKSKAVQNYLDTHSDDGKGINNYIYRFERCYPAAAMLYGLDNLGKVSSEAEAQAESMILRSIVDDILKIPGIENISEPRRMVAFYALANLKGNFDDFNRWLNMIRKYRPQFLEGVPFSFVCLSAGDFLFYANRKPDINRCLKNTMIRVEENGDGWSIISEECLGVTGLNDRLELTISPDNKKTLHYVYNSPSCRRQSDFKYEF